MDHPSGGARERGGSFADPNERASTSNPAKEEIQRGDVTKSVEEKALEDVQKHNHTQQQPTPELDSQFECSAPTRHHLGDCQRLTSRTSTAAAFSMIPQTSARFNPGSSRSTQPEPPVTRATLAELDVPRIVLNPKLRHDVNFDPDLHFRPNLDGEKGRRKLQKANIFWDMLKKQLMEFMVDPAKFEAGLVVKEWCLPATLRAIGEILETLVPPEDRSAVSEIMNVQLLMQQLSKGVADLESLAAWLSKTLKLHCAPMRDEWVNEMVVQLSSGNQTRDINMLALGMQTLMGVLEAMKLDVANHQIRCLRPLLISDTVDFEQAFFMKKIAARRVDVTYAHSWYQAAGKSMSSNPTIVLEGADEELAVFFAGFARCLLPSCVTERVPDTFMFDEERIIKLRTDVVDAINMQICVQLFQKVYAESQQQSQTRATESEDTHMSSQSSPDVPDFRGRMMASSTATERGRFRQSTFPDTLVWEPSGSPTPSLSSGSIHSSNSSRSSTPSSFQGDRSSRPSSLYLSPQAQPSLLPSDSEEATLLSHLTAIMADVTASATANSAVPSQVNRWSTAAPHLAVAIVHNTSQPIVTYSTVLPHVERILESALSNTGSLLFQKAEKAVLSALSVILSQLTAEFASLNNSRLFEVAVLPRGRAVLDKILKNSVDVCDEQAKPVAGREEILEMARGIAHMGMLHWKIWAPLCYTMDPDLARMDTSEEPLPSSHRSSSCLAADIRQQEKLREKKRKSLRRRSRELPGASSRSLP